MPLADRRTFVAHAAGVAGLAGVAHAFVPPAPHLSDEAQANGAAALSLRFLVAVRHAEKESGGDDPALTEQGKARAAALADLLAGAGVTHLFASEYRRTLDTLAPLSDAVGIEVTRRPARDVAALASFALAAPSGSVVVVAGHSNTVPELVRACGGAVLHVDERGFLDEASYDRLFLVALASTGGEARAASTLELRYGP